jgi:hypothetical protein
MMRRVMVVLPAPVPPQMPMMRGLVILRLLDASAGRLDP